MTLCLLLRVCLLAAELTWYNPALGGTNCDRSCDRYATGEAVQARHYGRVLACPTELPIGTEFVIVGSRWNLADGTYTCKDRGGAVVVKADGSIVLDLLLSTPIYGETLTVLVFLPLDASFPDLPEIEKVAREVPRHSVRKAQERFAGGEACFDSPHFRGTCR